MHALASLLLPLLVSLGGFFPPPPPSTGSLPVAPVSAKPVAGIPEPCLARHPFPAGRPPAATRALMQSTFGIRLTGPGWNRPEYRPVVKILWETLDGVGCSGYLDAIKSRDGGLRLHAGSTGSWAWGDWGLSHPGAVTLDFSKLVTAHREGDDGRIVRVFVHELGHVYTSLPAHADAVREFHRLHRTHGRFSDYGRGANETMSEVIGYYVARCAEGNPYDTGRHAAYYRWARTMVFSEVEFGPAPGRVPSC